MEHFKELLEASDLTEATAVIQPNKGVTGSLCKEFTQKESDDILKALMKNTRADYELDDFINQFMDEKLKYSEQLPVTIGSRSFYIYSANGRLRAGTGGSHLTACKELQKDDLVSMLVKALPTAEIK